MHPKMIQQNEVSTSSGTVILHGCSSWTELKLELGRMGDCLVLVSDRQCGSPATVRQRVPVSVYVAYVH